MIIKDPLFITADDYFQKWFGSLFYNDNLIFVENRTDYEELMGQVYTVGL